MGIMGHLVWTWRSALTWSGRLGSLYLVVEWLERLGGVETVVVSQSTNISSMISSRIRPHMSQDGEPRWAESGGPGGATESGHRHSTLRPAMGGWPSSARSCGSVEVKKLGCPSAASFWWPPASGLASRSRKRRMRCEMSVLVGQWQSWELQLIMSFSEMLMTVANV